MGLSPQNYDPKKVLLEELELQRSTVYQFFTYVDHFKHRLQFFDLEHQSDRVMKYLQDTTETRNIITSQYDKFLRGLEEGDSHIVITSNHQKFQNEVIDYMDEMIEETIFLLLPKDLPDETKKDVNELRARVHTSLEKIKDIYHDNDLGKGGEPVLT